MLIIPAIDLFDGKCVRLHQGRKNRLKDYDANPLEVALEFEAQGARMLHLVDLNGAFQEWSVRNRKVAMEIMRTVRIPVQFGGGLRSASDIEDIISAGANQVIVSTVPVESPRLFEEFVRRFGNRVLVGIAARNGRVAIRGWTRLASLRCMDFALRVASVGVERIIYTETALDGTLSGINIEQSCAISRESGLRMTVSGGIGSLEDVERIHKAASFGIDSMIIGRALYEGVFTLQDAQEVSNNRISRKSPVN